MFRVIPTYRSTLAVMTAAGPRPSSREGQRCTTGSRIRDYRSIRKALAFVETPPNSLFRCHLESDSHHSLNDISSLETRPFITRRTRSITRYTNPAITRSTKWLGSSVHFPRGHYQSEYEVGVTRYTNSLFKNCRGHASIGHE